MKNKESRSFPAFDTPVRDAYGYNARSEVTSARRALADNPNQGVRGFSYDYAYDPIGNRTSSTEYDHEDHARVSSYTANELNQYEQRTVPGYAGVRGSATNNATVTVNGNAAWRLGEYFYGGDDVENAASAVMKELDITAVVNPSGTNEADIVQSVTGKVYVAKSPETFTYDDDGNMLSDGRFVYTWDGENRLVSVETSTAAATAGAPHVKVAYTYDPRSRRIGKVVSHFENDTWTVAESRSFVYDGWNMVQEFSTLNSQLSILNSYVWGLDLSGSLQGAGGVGGLLSVVKDGTAYNPAFDGNGNVCEYSSTDGSIVAHYEYSPFGETVVQSGELADSFTFRFSTKYWEDEAKLYYYGYRFYAPGVGRWLNRDPIGELGGANVYRFSGNDAISGWDMLGLAELEEIKKLLKAISTARKSCAQCCPKIYDYLNCMEKGVVGSNKKLIEVLDKLASDIGSVKGGSKKLETATDVLDFLQEVFDKNVFDPEKIKDISKVLERAGKILDPASKVAKLGASVSRADLLDLFLVVGEEFGPKGIDSLFGYYLESYRTAIKMIGDIAFKDSFPQKINIGADFCDSDCGTAGQIMGSGYGDPWGCHRKLR